jgi:hypothetical protein
MRVVKRAVDATREVASARDRFAADAAEVLSRYHESIARPVTFRDLERMTRDADCSAGLETLRESILADGYSITVDVEEGKAGYARALRIAQFCERSLSGLEEPFEETFEQLLDALWEGHKLAEQTFRKVLSGQDRGYLLHRSIAVKERGRLSFVVDAARRVLGYLRAEDGTRVTPETFIPAEKIVRLTIKPRNRDPRGTSLLLAAYNAWVLKREALPLFLDWLVRWAEPTVFGFTATSADDPQVVEGEDGAPLVDDEGCARTVRPTRAMADELANITGRRAFAFSKDAKVQVEHSQGEIAIWERGFAMLGQWITNVILLTAMATREGRHHSRAAADVAVDVMDLRTASLKRVSEACVRTQILRPLVRLNFGDEAAALFTPRFSWGDVERRVSAEEAGALAKLMKFADEAQRGAMFTALGYPPARGDARGKAKTPAEEDEARA